MSRDQSVPLRFPTLSVIHGHFLQSLHFSGIGCHVSVLICFLEFFSSVLLWLSFYLFYLLEKSLLLSFYLFSFNCIYFHFVPHFLPASFGCLRCTVKSREAVLFLLLLLRPPRLMHCFHFSFKAVFSFSSVARPSFNSISFPWICVLLLLVSSFISL